MGLNVTVFAERLVCLLCWTFVSLGVRVCWWRSLLCVGTARWRKHNNRLCKEVELWSKEKEKSKRFERRWDDFTLLLLFVYCMVTSSCRINHSLIYMYEVLMLVLPGDWFTLVPVALGLVAMLQFSFWHLDCKDSPTWCKLQCLLCFTGRRKVSKLLIWCCAYDSAALESYTYYHPPRPLSCIFLSQWNISSWFISSLLSRGWSGVWFLFHLKSPWNKWQTTGWFRSLNKSQTASQWELSNCNLLNSHPQALYFT